MRLTTTFTIMSFSSGLLSAIINVKATSAKEENWQTRLNILLETHDEYTKKEMPEIADEMLNQFHELRNNWLAVAKSWSEVTNSLLSNDTINNWYIQELIKAVRC